jgi:hypothetical protein
MSVMTFLAWCRKEWWRRRGRVDARERERDLEGKEGEGRERGRERNKKRKKRCRRCPQERNGRKTGRNGKQAARK